MGSGGSKSTTDLAAKTEKAETTPADQQAQTPPPAPIVAAVETQEVSAGDAKPKYKVVFVLGGPGSGKGTNCTRIKEQFGYEHLSAGDLLRAERESGSALADMINTYIKEGKIVPAEVTVGLLRKAMDLSTTDKFLVDGFPRDLMNLECWNKEMELVAEVLFLLFLDCPNEIVVERLLERGKTSGRSDDNAESIQKRLVTYDNQTRPIIEHFRGLDKVRQVNSNRSQEEVFADVAAHFA
jgi:UMP-CMP kinase